MAARDADIFQPRDDPESKFFRDRGPLIYPPHDLLVQREGNGIRLAAIDRGRYISSGSISSATKYAFRWVREMDFSTRAKADAARKLSVLVDQVSRTYVEREAIYGTLLTDAKYSTGYFICVGMDDQGHESAEYVVSALQTNEILNGAIPGPVTDLQVSESGEVANGTVLSVLAFTYISPSVNGDSFTGIQPVIDDYPAIGDRTQYTPLLYSGPPYQGAGGGILRIPPARRSGDGSISIAGTAVTGVGTKFRLFAQANDQIEVFGVRRRIQSVDSDTAITLTAAWPSDPPVSGVTYYTVIGKCRVYALALSQTREHTYDETQWPYVDVDIDGELSAPNAPASLTLVSFGNGIRGQFVQVAGVGIKEYVVKRSTGTTDNINTATEIIPAIKHDATTQNGGTVLQFEDTKFTTYERETGQVFRYYIQTVNVRDERSSGYATSTATCRLDNGSDGSDPTFRMGLFNLLFNAGFAGTAGNAVAGNETSQRNAFNRVVAGTHEPGRPYGTTAGHGGQALGVGDYRGYTFWEGNDGGTGAGGAAPAFQSGNEVHISAPGNTKAWYVIQEVEAWDSNAAAPATPYIKIRKNAILCWQVKLARQSGGSQPDGTIGIYIDLYNNNTFITEAPRRDRNSTTDVLEWRPAAFSHIDVSGADLTTDWALYYGIFKCDSSLGTIRQVRVNIGWFNGTQGTVRLCDPMLNDGEEPGVFTIDMGDPTKNQPIPTNPPGGVGDSDGHRDGKMLVP